MLHTSITQTLAIRLFLTPLTARRWRAVHGLHQPPSRRLSSGRQSTLDNDKIGTHELQMHHPNQGICAWSTKMGEGCQRSPIIRTGCASHTQLPLHVVASAHLLHKCARKRVDVVVQLQNIESLTRRTQHLLTQPEQDPIKLTSKPPLHTSVNMTTPSSPISPTHS